LKNIGIPSSIKIEIATSKKNGDRIIKKIKAISLLNTFTKRIKCF